MKKSYFQSAAVFALVLLIIIFFLQGAFFDSIVHADDDSTGGLVPCNNKCTLCHLLVGMQNIFKYLTGLLFVATMFFVTFTGALYMVSAGSKNLLEQARKSLSYCWKGFLLFLICWVIITGILKTLGYKQLDNWWEFECDTTQTEGPAPTTPATPITPSPTGSKLGSYKASDNLSPKAQEVINNYMNTQVGKKYDGDVHCWSTTNAAYTLSGLPGLGNRWKVWDGDPNSIRPGCAMQIEGVHTFLVLENGATSSAPPKGYIGVNRDGLNYNINRANKLNRRLLIIYPD